MIESIVCLTVLDPKAIRSHDHFLPIRIHLSVPIHYRQAQWEGTLAGTCGFHMFDMFHLFLFRHYKNAHPPIAPPTSLLCRSNRLITD